MRCIACVFCLVLEQNTLVKKNATYFFLIPEARPSKSFYIGKQHEKHERQRDAPDEAVLQGES
jgi:hypothetical protein